MRTRSILLLTLAAAAIAAFSPHSAKGQERAAPPVPTTSAPTSSAPPRSTGMLGTLRHGTYECALPGDAGSQAFVVVPEEGFRIGAASSYESINGGGIYFLRGKEMVFTRGPKKDQRYLQKGDNTLQKRNPDGSLSKLICTRISSAN